MRRIIFVVIFAAAVSLHAQQRGTPDWKGLEDETMRHFQALLRFDTSDPPMTPPGGERSAADYLMDVLATDGIPAQLLALEPNRPNVVARLKGNGTKRPLLLMGHTDVVNVDPKKWTHAPFSATRHGGYVYGRGAIDDKDNVVAVLMVMLTLKRSGVPLDRDVIALFEAGEEGATRVGIQYVVDQHFSSVDAEFCLAEGGNVTRQNGEVKYASIQALEKLPRGIILTARGASGHGSMPLQSNAIVHLADAVAKIGKWSPPIRLNETTTAYFKRLATVSSPAEAERYRNVLSANPEVSGRADEYFRANDPRHASMLRTSVSPNIFQGGYRVNVIPSEAVATLDVRMLPDENPQAFLQQVKAIIDDPAIEVTFSGQNARPPGTTRLHTEAYAVLERNVTKHYKAITVPTMSNGATDMAFLRAKGVQCYGIGPATDVEDIGKGFGAHSDQERILESELHRFVRFHYDVVADIARSR